MTLLSIETLQSIHTRAIAVGLDAKRPLLLAGLPRGFVAGLPESGAPSDQLFSDLARMNEVPVIAGGLSPLVHWLSQAAFFTASLPNEQSWFNSVANEAARQAKTSGATPGENAHTIAGADRLPERIIHSNDLLPARFLHDALKVSRSVARLTTPVFKGIRPVLGVAGRPQKCFGTGWLVGPRHLLTNYHVVAARQPGQVAATKEEFELQACQMSADFDYFHQDGEPGLVAEVAGVRAADAILDYALLELAESRPEREPLTLARQPITLDPGSSVSVNIVQHPGGAAMQLGIRNNLVVDVSGQDLAYYTDTAGGSSGSPVCNDDWLVVALHKASTIRFGKLNFQGKETAWVNIGTPITLVVEHLRSREEDLWNTVGARMA